ncbi:hypothetical protein ACEQ8H_004371 [Pleosporales sp. CAS-2024a]
MSGPYRFQGEPAKSPLERSASPFSAGQPVSFKTNVHRAKTKKWVTAKKNAYDGDDWGGYDEYDEYAADAQPQPAPAQSQRYYAPPQPQRTHTDRSFTEPMPPGRPAQPPRNSFEAGEEHRAFSASMPPPQPSPAASGLAHEPQKQRDVTPSARPLPLQTHMSPVPSDMHASPARSQFPPRKSSIGQPESPAATSPQPRPGSHSDKALPFVRPADIYKRMQEERQRERASLDSSQPSLDSLSARPKDDLHSPTSDGARQLQPRETVAERKSSHLSDLEPAFAHDKQSAMGGLPSQAIAPAVASSGDQGIRSVVDKAFTRNDDQRSVPPTPISNDDDSSMSRTTTGSTTGISPIMSGVPSGATSAMKRAHVGGDGSTPVIVEEPSETASFVSGTTSSPTAPFNHSRNISASPLPRSGLATPTRGDSPARSPLLSPQKDGPEPKAAQIAAGSPDESHAMERGLGGPSSAYAVREADIATAAMTNSVDESRGLGVAEQRAQDAFLESHAGQSPIEDALPRSRSESPSKGRVHALAGKFGDVSSSRRGSTQSTMSRNSIQSWEKSQHSSRAPSPTKGNPSKPSSPAKEFRPHLPGQWESFATTVATPLDQSEKDRSLGAEKDTTSRSLQGAELAPTTAKQPVVDETNPGDAIDPIAALKNAGAAMAQSLKTTVGMNEAFDETHSEQSSIARGPSHGDVYMPRPLQLERASTSLSSIPPTPPTKDTTRTEEPPRMSSDVDEGTPVQHRRPDFFPQLSTHPSADDQESDRLRKEIVASLTPVVSTDPNRKSSQPVSPEASRASSILPTEYDSYWTDNGHGTSPQPSQDREQNGPATSPAIAALATTHANDQHKPSLLNRFSWENNTPQLAVPEKLAEPLIVPEPTKTPHIETIPSTEIEHASHEERKLSSEGLPEPYFGPAHTITITKPDPITEPEPATRSPTASAEASSLASLTREHTRSPGLHVVNSAVDPEAVDLPPRLSADMAARRRDSGEEPMPLQQEMIGEKLNPAISAPLSAPGPQTPNRTNAPALPAISPTSAAKPLGAREIATMSSAAERIAIYNKTREHWATQDHGLGVWLACALETNPDLATQTTPFQSAPTGTMRRKHTASLSRLGKFGSASTYQLASDQSPTTSTQGPPIGTDSPTAGAPGSAAAFDRRVASRQLEAKGKDLLHTANVLSGKGLTSAKGLFAKGKSRFGREKVEK